MTKVSSYLGKKEKGLQLNVALVLLCTTHLLAQEDGQFCSYISILFGSLNRCHPILKSSHVYYVSQSDVGSPFQL